METAFKSRISEFMLIPSRSRLLELFLLVIPIRRRGMHHHVVRTVQNISASGSTHPVGKGVHHAVKFHLLPWAEGTILTVS